MGNGKIHNLPCAIFDFTDALKSNYGFVSPHYKLMLKKHSRIEDYALKASITM
jgi:hypothetical protein